MGGVNFVGTCATLVARTRVPVPHASYAEQVEFGLAERAMELHEAEGPTESAVAWFQVGVRDLAAPGFAPQAARHH